MIRLIEDRGLGGEAHARGVRAVSPRELPLTSLIEAEQRDSNAQLLTFPNLVNKLPTLPAEVN